MRVTPLLLVGIVAGAFAWGLCAAPEGSGAEGRGAATSAPTPAWHGRGADGSFGAIQFTKVGKFPGQFAGVYGEFTLEGPKAETLKPLPKDVCHVAYDPVSKRCFALGRHDAYEIDLAAGTGARMTIPANLPELSWPCGLTFDTKRQRVLLASLGGVGYLYSFTPGTNVWAVVCDMDNVDLACLTYDAGSDQLYGLAYQRGDAERPRVMVFDAATGKPVRTIRLDDPVIPAALGRREPMAPPVQLAVVGGELAVVTMDRIFAVELSTSKARVAWERK